MQEQEPENDEDAADETVAIEEETADSAVSGEEAGVAAESLTEPAVHILAEGMENRPETEADAGAAIAVETGEEENAAADDDEIVDEDEADGDESRGPALPLVSVVEAVLFAAREPLKAAQIARAVGKGTRQEAVRAAIDELNVQYLETGRAFEIAEISGRHQLMSRPEYVTHIMRIYPKRELSEKDKTTRLTPAALDTLSIIAYKQPVTRGEIEHIRGVGCGPVLRALIERGTIRIAGKKTDVVGQPLVYGTTEAFLAEFGLGSLDELPLRNEFLGVTAEMMAEPTSEIGAPAEVAEGIDVAAETEDFTDPEADETSAENTVEEDPMEVETDEAEADGLDGIA